MKKFLIVYTIGLFSLWAFSQEIHVLDGGKTVENKSTRYRYNFSLKADSIQLSLIDSLVTIKNNKLKIRTITLFTEKNKQTSNQIVYLNKFGLDSIRKWIEKDNLVKTELLKYDKKNRLTSSILSDLRDNKNNSTRIYQYIDSIAKDGKVSTIKVFRTYADMLYSLDYIIKTYLDKQGDTIKQVRVDKKTETEILNKYKSTIRIANTIIFKQETCITKEELKDQSKLIKKYLQLLIQKLNDTEYVSLEYTFIDEDNNVQLFIKKDKWKKIQQVIITVNDKW